MDLMASDSLRNFLVPAGFGGVPPVLAVLCFIVSQSYDCGSDLPCLRNGLCFLL